MSVASPRGRQPGVVWLGAVAALAVLAAGCGQKGPLRLPETPPTATGASAAPAAQPASAAPR